MNRFTLHAARRPSRRLVSVVTAAAATVPSLVIVAGHASAIAANIKMH